MHTKSSVPVVKKDVKMSKAIITMTRKSFGCLGVLDDYKNLVGIITDGDLRRKIKSNFFEKSASQVMTKNPMTANKKMLDKV